MLTQCTDQTEHGFVQRLPSLQQKLRCIDIGSCWIIKVINPFFKLQRLLTPSTLGTPNCVTLRRDTYCVTVFSFSTKMVRFDENSQFAGLYAVGHLMSSKWKISEKKNSSRLNFSGPVMEKPLAQLRCWRSFFYFQDRPKTPWFSRIFMLHNFLVRIHGKFFCWNPVLQQTTYEKNIAKSLGGMWLPASKTNLKWHWKFVDLPYQLKRNDINISTIHGTGVFTCIWLTFMV